MRISGGNFAARKAATCSLAANAHEKINTDKYGCDGQLRTNTDNYGQMFSQ